MDATQKLICERTKQKLQSVLLVQGNSQPIADDAHIYVQLLFDNNHCVATALLNGHLYLANIYSGYPMPTLAKQLQELYGHKINSNGKLEVIDLPVQQQPNGADCGLFAIANGFAFASGTLPFWSTLTYDHIVMRKHLLNCFNARTMLPFPALPVVKRGRPRKERVLYL
jgi:hypothetical protein